MTRRMLAMMMCATLSFVALLTLLVALAGSSVAAAQTIPTPTQGAGVSNGAGPTATLAQIGNVLPPGTLILEQRSQPIALLPGGAPLSLKPEQYGAQASANGALG